MDDSEIEQSGGEIPEGVGPEIFREHLEQESRRHADDGAHITLEEENLYLEDIQGVEPESGTGRSRVRLRNGVIIGGLEVTFFAANLTKIVSGGWLPLTIAAVIVTLMTTWRTGADILTQRRRELEGPLDEFVAAVEYSLLAPGKRIRPVLALADHRRR